jgi:preprotein translocase subunit SecG
MFNLLAIGWEHYAFTIPLSVLSVFLMLVILVQRGRGGGLTGALGGMGGQSAFGTKAGDLFTRITVGVAAVWILLSMAALKFLNKTGTATAAQPPGATAPGPGATTTTPPATKAPETKAPDSTTPDPADAEKSGTSSKAPE